MANLSDVSGTLTITAKDWKECEEILSLIELITNHWYYNFDTQGEPWLAGGSMGPDPENDTEWLGINFTASGRWSFANNIERFGAWLQNTKDPEAQLYIKKLTEKEFKLFFDYNEDEPGVSFIGVGTALLHHKANIPLEEMEVIDQDFEEYELTVENLVELRDFDEDYAKQYLGEIYESNSNC